MTDEQCTYMYGEFEKDVAALAVQKDVTDVCNSYCAPDTSDAFLREQLITSLIPIYKGDQIDGMISVARKLEAYINNG